MGSESSKNEYNNLLKENLKLKAELQLLKGEKKAKGIISNWLSPLATNFLVGKGLKKSMLRLYEELPQGRVTKVTLADVSSHLIWRITRIGTFALLIGIVPLFILGVQTYILNTQNRLLSYQNKRLDQQINLEEGNRRSSLIFLMSNIMDKIGDELRDPRNRKRVLSDELIGRIVSLSQAMRPYRYLEDDKLIAHPLSPERGQLLFSLSNSFLSIETYDKLFERADFSFAELKDANFNEAYLEGVKLHHANLVGATFRNADLEYADLLGANLEGVNFEESNLTGVDFTEANLKGGTLKNVTMTDAILNNADFTGAYISGDFRRSVIDGIDLDEVKIGHLDLEGVEIRDDEMAMQIDTNDVASIFEVTGRTYLNENFVWEKKQFRDGGNEEDYYSLARKKASTLSTIENCRKKVLEIIKSSKKIKQIEREVRKKKENLLFLVEAHPFGDESLGISIDSVYLYKLTTEASLNDAELGWVAFDPVHRTVQSITPKDTTFLSFNQSLLKSFPVECQ